MTPPDYDPRAFVVITLKDVYDAVLKLDGTVNGMAHIQTTAENRAVDHEARLRNLERSRWPLPSLAALVSIAAVAIALVSLLTR